MKTKKKDDKLELILSAAAELISEKGYEQTSFSDIATKVGLGKSTLFHYLKNKEELLVRIYEKGVGQVSSELIKVSNDDKLAPEEKLKWAISHHLTMFLEATHESAIFLNELGTLSDDDQKRFRARRREYQKRFEQIIIDLKEKGYFKGLDTTGVTFNILGILNSVPRWYRKQGRLSLMEICDIIFRMVIQQPSFEGEDTMNESVATKLATFICDISYDNLPDSVIFRAKNMILDTLGVALAGCDMPGSRIAWKMVGNSKGDATVFGHNVTIPPIDAVLANIASANALALDDFLFTFHPGQINIPTAIALAEEEGASGSDLITAVVAGYEAMGRVYLGAQMVRPGFRGVSVFGPFGAAAVAGKLLKLDLNQMTSALCFAANSASGLTQCWIDGTMEGHFHGGTAARNGITAARLAEAGAVASDKTLEGKSGFYQAFTGTSGDVANVLLGLGTKFLIMDVCYKPFPVCAHQQIPIRLALQLAKQYDINPQTIKVIVERVSHWEANFPGTDFAGPFKNSGQTLLSAQFCAAAAFLGKPVNLPTFYEESFEDPVIFNLAQKVVLIGEKDRETREISVTLKDGTTYHIDDVQEKNTLEPTDENIKTKFYDLTRPFMREDKADELRDIVMSLEKIADIRVLTDKLKEC